MDELERSAMQQGETIKATASALNNEGEGVIRCGDEHFVLFVPNALPGEEILCRAVKVKKNYGIGKVLERYNDSPDRVEPICSHFGKCGGCQLQHLSYTAQVSLKQQTVIDALARIGGLENPIVDECVPSPKEWGYRNKASLPVQSENTFTSGFYKPRSHDIVPFDKCPVLMPELEHYIKLLLAELVLLAKDSKNDKNNIIKFIRHIVFRRASNMRETLCAIIGSSDLKKFDAEKLNRIIQKISPEIKGLIYNKNTSDGNFIWGTEFQTVFGCRTIKEKLSDYLFEFEISSFFQVNSEQAINIYKHAAKLALADAPNKVLELYSGVGSFTSFLADGAKNITAVESWEPAAKYALSNARLNHQNNITPFSGRAENIITSLSEESFDVIVLDPPRTGCDDAVINTIIKINPAKIVYVSCNPATMARDIKKLAASGYKLKTTTPYDMFPQTGHVETVVLMSRKDK